MNNIKLTTDEILNKEFSVDFKGYSPIEVDQFLDIVMADYANYAQLVNDLNAKNAELEAKINELNSKLVDAEGKIKNDQANIEMNQSNNTQVDILRRIARLEQAVFNQK